MTPPRPTSVFYWGAVTLLTLPLVLIMVTSLTDSTLVGFPLGHLSFRWYVAALTDPANGHAFLLSLTLAGASSILTVIAGTWIALAAGMLPPPWRWLLLAGTLVPLVTPGIVHAIALRVAIQAIGLAPGPLAILLGHTVHTTPLAAIMIGARLATTPLDQMDAARGLGAGSVKAFWNVQLPWLASTLVAALLLAALNSFDDFVRSFFMGGYEATLPVLIFARLRSGLTPEINALATLALIATLGVGGMIVWLTRRFQGE